MPDEFIHKIVYGTASESEKVEFFKKIEHDTELREEYFRHKKIIAASGLLAEYPNQIQNGNFEKFWKKVHQNKSGNIVLQLLKYAAVFVAALTLGYYAFDYSESNSTNKTNASQTFIYTSGKGSISTINMVDGSTIWLSSNSNLIIDSNPNGKMVAKLKGEAFFDLIPDSKRDLIVDVGHFRIKDVGTKFNIRSYDDEKIISSSLIEGSIELLNASGNPFLVVKPGESVNYDKTSRSANIKNIDSSVVTAWKDGKFVFIDEPLSEICKELENWYNVEIRIEDHKLAETRYTSVVRRSTTVEMVLKILALTDKIKYEIMDKTEGKDVVTIKK